MTPAVDVRSLTHAYGSREAIHGLDFALAPGEILGLIGPNGAGKTTTLRILAGTLRPRSGSALVLGRDAARLDENTRAAVGFASESLRLPERPTVGALIAFTRACQPGWDDARHEHLARAFRLEPGVRVGALSRGQRAKLAFLLAACHRPRLLLLDEPFGGLDAVAREEILEELLTVVSDTGCAVLIASHDLGQVERVTDRVALLHAGRLVFCEPIEALLERHRRVRLTFPSDGECDERWLERGIAGRREGRVLEYVATSPDRDGAPPAPVNARVETSPMGLEEIFVTWTRHLDRRVRP